MIRLLRTGGCLLVALGTTALVACSAGGGSGLDDPDSGASSSGHSSSGSTGSSSGNSTGGGGGGSTTPEDSGVPSNLGDGGDYTSTCDPSSCTGTDETGANKQCLDCPTGKCCAHLCGSQVCPSNQYAYCDGAGGVIACLAQ